MERDCSDWGEPPRRALALPDRTGDDGNYRRDTRGRSAATGTGGAQDRRTRMTDQNAGPTHEAPYRGLRVLDFGQGIASPIAARCWPPTVLTSSRSNRPRATGRGVWERPTAATRRSPRCSIVASAACAWTSRTPRAWRSRNNWRCRATSSLRISARRGRAARPWLQGAEPR